MADVLLGRADGIEGFERHVVLKRIRPEHARDQRFIRMFLDEARVAANLHHQHIVQVHDIGESDGEFFIAMEYIHGEDVRSILSAASKRRAHVPLGLAVAIVSAAASGLHYAHERRGNDRRPLGIVHRDISPSNILVGYDGSIKVLDFGIAKASMRTETRSGSLKGKISYMSPEQLKGAPIDRRSDVYSLGVVLYELATTTRLFKGDSDYMVMDQIVNGRVSLPQVRRPDLPNELSAIIMRAIAPDPERRYFTAEEFRVAIDQFANKTGLTASTSAIGSYLRKQFGDRPEPWLELEAQGIYSFDDLQKPPEESAPSNTWTEMAPADEIRRNSTSSIPRLSGRIGAGPTAAAAESPATDPGRAQPSLPRLPSTPPPTDSKMGWESQRPAPRGFTPTKVALICAPLILILVVLLWKLSTTPDSDATVAAASPPPAPPAAAAAAPVVTPLPEPPRPAIAATPEPVEEPSRSPEPIKRSTAPSVKRTATKAADPPEPPAKTPPVPTTSLGPPIPAAPPAAAVAAATPPPAQVAAAAAPGPGSAVPAPAAPPAAPAPAPAAPASGSAAPPAQSVAAAAAPAPALAPLVPQNVAASALDAYRSGGDKEIVPDAATRTAMSRSGTDKISGRFKLCLTIDGAIGTVAMVKSTGYPNYDERIQSTIRSQWRFKPFLSNGKPTPVCTMVSFIYAQS